MDLKPKSLNVQNTGDTLKISFNFPSDSKVIIRDGPLENDFILDNVHWHWGENDEAGSEHELDSKKYSAEMHLVTYNSKYGKKF